MATRTVDSDRLASCSLPQRSTEIKTLTPSNEVGERTPDSQPEAGIGAVVDIFLSWLTTFFRTFMREKS